MRLYTLHAAEDPTSSATRTAKQVLFPSSNDSAYPSESWKLPRFQ